MGGITPSFPVCHPPPCVYTLLCVSESLLTHWLLSGHPALHPPQFSPHLLQEAFSDQSVRIFSFKLPQPLFVTFLH